MKTLALPAPTGVRHLSVKVEKDRIVFCGQATVTIPRNSSVRNLYRPQVTFVAADATRFITAEFDSLPDNDLEDLVGIELRVEEGDVLATLIGALHNGIYRSTARISREKTFRIFAIFAK